MWEATLWSVMVLLALFVFLSSFLPKVNGLWGGIEGNEWFESNRHFGFLINRVFTRLIEYPEFLMLGALGFISLALLHYGLKKLGMKETPRILIWSSTLLGLIVLIGAISLGLGPIIVVNP